MDQRRPHDPSLAEDAALRLVLEGTAAETGAGFLAALVQNLARALGTHAAWVAEYLEASRRLRALAFWLGDHFVDDFEYEVSNTPCEAVVVERRYIHIPERVIELYPRDPDLPPLGAVSYAGAPLQDSSGVVLGHLAVLHTAPMPERARDTTLFRIFAARAAAELRRMRAEAALREREAKLSGLIGGAMDAIVELDGELRITGLNPAAERAFGGAAGRLLGTRFAELVSPDDGQTLQRLRQQLDERSDARRSLWISPGLRARTVDGVEFPAEATLSRFELRGAPYYALILRNVNDRLQSERTIRSLTAETAYLKEELRALRDADAIIGDSPALAQVLEAVSQVAGTDATVLVLGETGTGKELIARRIHAESRRRDKPFVAVNCAAVPSTLVESEFFGHEAGAFTGATKRREGRFALADGGTIFLDEIGELPLELQAKLLRVLQDGTFEPVGSSQTRRVDIRIIAATNRALEQAVRAGGFREDLFYRLNVFPIAVPPLRQRGGDVVQLAAAFAAQFAAAMRRSIAPLTERDAQRLCSYAWPGNVRELRNVIERAVITVRDGQLQLDLPEPAAAAPGPAVHDGGAAPVHTAEELRAIERANILRALERTDWRVAGPSGAAQLLGMNPSTLASRMKALGISRSRPG
jgi:PAS domain S-box-containing protein